MIKKGVLWMLNDAKNFTRSKVENVTQASLDGSKI